PQPFFIPTRHDNCRIGKPGRLSVIHKHELLTEQRPSRDRGCHARSEVTLDPGMAHGKWKLLGAALPKALWPVAGSYSLHTLGRETKHLPPCIPLARSECTHDRAHFRRPRL